MGNAKKPLSAEEMALLVDGLASPEKMEAFRGMMLDSAQERDEYFDLAAAVDSSPMQLPAPVIDRHMDRLFPVASLDRILVKLGAQVLVLVEASGWSRPVLRFREAGLHSDGMALNRHWNDFNIGFSFRRISLGAVNLTLTLYINY